MLQPIVFVIRLLLIDSTALQQTFNDECRAYLEEGGILKLKLPEKNETSNRKIELKEEATIIRKEGKFGLRWENNREEFFDNDCVRQFVEKASETVRETHKLPDKDRTKYYSCVNYYVGGEAKHALDKYIKARREASAVAAAGDGGEYLAEGQGAGACALFSSLS